MMTASPAFSFQGFAAGRFFTDHAVGCLRRFATWVLWAAVSEVLAGMVTSVVLTFRNPPGTRQLALTVDGDQIVAVLLAGIVWVMAAVIAEGKALADENAAFL